MMDRRKGIGYMIEGFLAALILFVFVTGTFEPAETQDWDSFQREIASKDLAHTLKDSGHLEEFIQRSETGSIQTAVSAISNGQLAVSGTVTQLPLGDYRLGFYTLPADRHTETLQEVSSGDRCDGDLEEISSEEPVLRSDETGLSDHGLRLYVADSDPKLPNSFNGDTDYDTVWVDNQTTCQFSASEGPFFLDQFLYWGNSSDTETDTNYDVKQIADNGDSLTLYRANQAVNIRNTMNQPVNGIYTETSFDTFTFGASDLTVYDTLVFRKPDALGEIMSGNYNRLQDYMKEGSVLFLMDLSQTDMNYQVMKDSGLVWMGLDINPSASGADFSETEKSQRVETYFIGQNGVPPDVSIAPGGKLASNTTETVTGDPLAYAGTGRYDLSGWNSEEDSMQSTNNPPAGSPESGCNDYTEETFTFPSGKTAYVLNTRLGDPCSSIRGLNIDLNGDGDFAGDPREGPYVNGDHLTISNRDYTVRIYDSSRAAFLYSGNSRVEIVNFRTGFETYEIERFARIPHEQPYDTADRKLVASVIYWLLDDEKSFGQETDAPISNTVVGSIKENTFMPYRIHLRWHR